MNKRNVYKVRHLLDCITILQIDNILNLRLILHMTGFYFDRLFYNFACI